MCSGPEICLPIRPVLFFYEGAIKCQNRRQIRSITESFTSLCKTLVCNVLPDLDLALLFVHVRTEVEYRKVYCT